MKKKNNKMNKSLLPSTFNTRALPIGDMRFIRSDCPSNLTDEEVQWLKDHNILTIIDLRKEKEKEQKPCRLEYESGFTYYNLPVSGGDVPITTFEDVLQAYIDMLDAQMDKIIETILNAPTNVMYFCAAGKDRTGVVSAILLKKHGFNDEYIINDYMYSKITSLEYAKHYEETHPGEKLRPLLPDERFIKAVLKRL